MSQTDHFQCSNCREIYSKPLCYLNARKTIKEISEIYDEQPKKINSNSIDAVVRILDELLYLYLV